MGANTTSSGSESESTLHSHSAEICPFPQLASLEARAEAWAKAQDEAVACLRILTQSVEFAICMGKLSPTLIDSLLLKRCKKAIAEAERA